MISKLSNLTLRTERLIIRPLKDADLAEIYPIHSDAAVNQYLPYDTWQSWSDAEQWLAKIQQRRAEKDAEQFVIALRNSQEIVGTCIAFNYAIHESTIEVGYVLARSAWKQGYMFEAMSAFLPALLGLEGIQSIRANVESDNSASIALIEKLGFVHIDTIIEADGVNLSRWQKPLMRDS